MYKPPVVEGEINRLASVGAAVKSPASICPCPTLCMLIGQPLYGAEERLFKDWTNLSTDIFFFCNFF